MNIKSYEGKNEQEALEKALKELNVSDQEVLYRFEEIKGKLSEVLSKIYFQMFSSDEIFKPVNSNEEATRYYEYGPFHLLASYFEKQGYVGLMYRSTVCSTGINIVLFNNRLVEVKHGSIENVQVNTFDLK